MLLELLAFGTQVAACSQGPVEVAVSEPAELRCRVPDENVTSLA